LGRSRWVIECRRCMRGLGATREDFTGTREGGIADNVLPPVEAEASGWVAFASGAVVH